jgi:hypothetical protein
MPVVTRVKRAVVALLLCVFSLALCSSTSLAQSRDESTQVPSEAFSTNPAPEVPSLGMARLEMISGIVLTSASFPVGVVVSFASGPPMLACLDLWGDDTGSAEQDECERRQQAQQDEARQTGMITGLVIGAIGLPLMIHGAIRTKRLKDERRRLLLRPTAWSLTPSPTRTTANLAWTF